MKPEIDKPEKDAAETAASPSDGSTVVRSTMSRRYLLQRGALSLASLPLGMASVDTLKRTRNDQQMAVRIDRSDSRYAMLRRSRNLRWNHEKEAVNEVQLCSTSMQVAEALRKIVKKGLRPTVRSGGHCYEDFVVNNPDGTLIDLSLLTNQQEPGDETRYRVSPGQQLGEVYLDLYKRYGVTLPAGSCYSVGAGGHISGAGFGLLSRLHGLTVDWLSAVELLTVDSKGEVKFYTVDKDHEPDLFRACRGAGGGNFGVITGFLFDRLPPAPFEVASVHLSFDWKEMKEETFINILLTFGDYWANRGCEPETWGLFSALGLTHISAGHFGLSLQFCNPNGRCEDLGPMLEFLDRFQAFSPINVSASASGDKRFAAGAGGNSSRERVRDYSFERLLWLDAAVGGGWIRRGGRAAYKSCYMKQNFTRAEARCFYKYLTRPVPGIDMGGVIIGIDSYGGSINKTELAENTSAYQRSSVMKLQFQQYWDHAEEDTDRLQWMRQFYTELYSLQVEAKYAGTPYHNEYYQGCYINYPDSDMLAYEFWPELYYGDQGLYPFLQGVKRRYDPNNIFHHKMSVQG